MNFTCTVYIGTLHEFLEDRTLTPDKQRILTRKIEATCKLCSLKHQGPMPILRLFRSRVLNFKFAHAMELQNSITRICISGTRYWLLMPSRPVLWTVERLLPQCWTSSIWINGCIESESPRSSSEPVFLLTLSLNGTRNWESSLLEYRFGLIHVFMIFDRFKVKNYRSKIPSVLKSTQGLALNAAERCVSPPVFIVTQRNLLN